MVAVAVGAAAGIDSSLPSCSSSATPSSGGGGGRVEASREEEDEEEEERLLPKELVRLMAIVCCSAGCAGAGDEEGEEGMAVPSSPSPFLLAGMDMDRTWEACPSSSSCGGDNGPSDTEEAREDGPTDSSTIRRPPPPPPPPPPMGDRGEGAGATAADPPPPNPSPAASVADSERLPRWFPPWGPMDAESAARTSSTNWAVKEPEREWRRPCPLALSPSLACMYWMVVMWGGLCDACLRNTIRSSCTVLRNIYEPKKG